MFQWFIGAVLLLTLCASARAADVVTLRDGRQVTGVVVRNIRGSVWIKRVGADGANHEEFFPGTNVVRIDLDPDSDLRKPPALPEPRPGAVKAAVISLGALDASTVGVHFTSETIKQCAQRLKVDLGDDKTGLVVLRLDSNGGSLSEARAVAQAIHHELKPSWRTVCWVDLGLDASVLSVYSVEELVFTRWANFGLSSHGSLVRSRPLGNKIADIDLESHVTKADRLSEIGGHDPKLLRSMVLSGPLSVDRTKLGGRLLFDDDTRGDVVLNRRGEALCLSASLAEKAGFSSGTADTLDELTKLLGYESLDWVGDRELATKEEPWPVCAAEVWNRAQRTEASKAMDRFNDLTLACRGTVRDAAHTEDVKQRRALCSQSMASLAELRNLTASRPTMAAFLLETDTPSIVIDEMEASLVKLEK